MLRPIKGRVFGDVHFCHAQTPSEKIFEEVRHYFPFSKDAYSYDITVLDGDYWDKLMPNNHPDTFTTEESIYYLLKWHKQHDCMLVIVDGTPLHDAGQMEKFVHINENSGIGADLIFVKDVDIKYIDKFDIHVLFIPDRPRSSPDDTYQRVKEIMEEKQLSKIDMAVMHGCFQYQLPEISADHKHIEENYLSIVKGPIFIGHVHTHSTFDRIIAPGSFSRLRHGEEEPKGMIDFVMDVDNSFKAKFIENELATIYKTITITGLNIDDSLDKIKRIVNKLPENSKVRIECEQGHPITADRSFVTLKAEYLSINWSIKVVTDKSVIATDKEVFSTENEYVPLIINENNIIELIERKAIERGNSKELIKLIPEYLQTII